MNVKPVALALLCAATLYGAQVPTSAISQESTNIIPANSVIEISDLEFYTSDWDNHSARATNRLDWSISPSTNHK
ncbi:hypothetical protein [Flintibacter faecis]|uniref:Uncharacterized protein n=1 Tax=Flintibacter faecis TaxID=2763047 RepID=A0A8J6J2N3_9FIRM|nr:hypothetical protein [Flintibacter faecis]MBC5716002.1 hypothetical protein [Flintibacter faecis]